MGPVPRQRPRSDDQPRQPSLLSGVLSSEEFERTGGRNSVDPVPIFHRKVLRLLKRRMRCCPGCGGGTIWATGRTAGRSSLDKTVNSPVTVRTFRKGSERKRVGNSEGCVNRRVREFFGRTRHRRPKTGVFLSGPLRPLSKRRVFVLAVESAQVLRGKAINEEGRQECPPGLICLPAGLRKW